MDTYARIVCETMFFTLGLQLILQSDQDEFNIGVALEDGLGGGNSDARAVIPSHSVDRNRDPVYHNCLVLYCLIFTELRPGMPRRNMVSILRKPGISRSCQLSPYGHGRNRPG